MVCAAISARISPANIERVSLVRLVPRRTQELGLNEVVDLISSSVIGVSGVILAEPGDLFNMEEWKVESILGRAFKHPQSLGERSAVELAHHVSLAGRRLIGER
jgi:hypothetical protein